MSAHIAIIEDEEDLLELLEYRLEKEGYEVTGFLSTKIVKDFLAQEEVDLMIVDRNLPNIEGSEFIRELKEEGNDTPVIFVSAKNQDSEIEEGFLRGADDYITKPFNINELVLRVKSILRRLKKDRDRLIHRDIEIFIQQREVYVDGVEIPLSKLEFELLRYFIEHKNIVLKRDRLLKDVWRDYDLMQEKSVNVTINRLKKKIDPNRVKEYIKPIRGFGYKLC